jgi:hypothetical protein
MFSAHQIVETLYGLGRVVYYDKLSHTAHVMVRTANNTWVIKQIDEVKIQPTETLLWTIQQAFKSKNYDSFIF